MPALFHVNPKTGNAGKCSVTTGRCPFGGEDTHYSTKDEARAAYEAEQNTVAPTRRRFEPYPTNAYPDIDSAKELEFPDREQQVLTELVSYIESNIRPGVSFGKSTRQGELDRYWNVATKWCNLWMANNTYGVAQDDYEEMTEFKAALEDMAPSARMPSPQDYVQAYHDRLYHEAMANINRDREAHGERFPHFDHSPANAEARRASLNLLRLELELAQADFRVARPNDELGAAKLKRTTAQVELEEAEAFLQTLPTRRWGKDRKQVQSDLARAMEAIGRVRAELQKHEDTIKQIIAPPS